MTLYPIGCHDCGKKESEKWFEGDGKILCPECYEDRQDKKKRGKAKI